MSDVVAEYELVGSEVGGSRFAVHAVLCRPMQIEATSSQWFCNVSASPFLSKPIGIYGDSSFQTLCLAARFVVQTLDTFMSQGGRLEHADGDSFDVDVFGFDMLPRTR
jgi:hypothetical protein